MPEAATEVTLEWIEAIQKGMLLALHARQNPDRPAITSEHGNRTFVELNGRANQLARDLRTRGFEVEDRIAVLLPNRPELAECYYAAVRIGVRFVPINWHLTAEEIAYILEDCAAKVFVADTRFAEQAVPAAAAAGTETLLAVDGAIEGAEPYEDAVTGDRTDIEDPVLGGAMLYTSGTTGRPKGVKRAIALGNQGQTATAYMELLAIAGYDAATDVHLVTGPLYHSAPLVLGLLLALAGGVGCVLMDGWDPEEMLALIERHRITHIHMVPTMFHRLLGLPEQTRRRYDLSSLRFIMHGAAPCPRETKQKMIDWLGPIVHEYYAATEGLGTFITAEEWLRKPGSVGKPEPGSILVRDESGRELPAGEAGLVYLPASEAARFEYFNDPDKTKAAYRGDHFTLGDIGYLDEDGYLFMIDRSADLIISGGVNIYPAEVDSALLGHEAVFDVCTIGVPNEEWGEEVKAVVQLRDSFSPSEALKDELIEFCRARLAHYKCPRSIDFVADLPRYETGKIIRRAVRDRY